ncbi:MAG: magnesium transporter [Gemmataceae bacterium]
MAHSLFSPELMLMLDEQDDAGLAAFCENLHPATIAEALAESLTVEQAWRVLSHTGIRQQAAVFEYLPPETQVAMVDGAGREHMARLIERMSHDDRADLLRRLSPTVAEGLLRLVDEADRRDIATLAGYRENIVGALMTTDYAWLPANLTAVEAVERLRQMAPDRETIYYIYILDESTRKLLGILSLRDLILASKAAKLVDLMDREVISVRADQDPETAARVLAQYDLLAVPVIDGDGRLVGIVTHDDAIDVVVQAATEDLQRQAAVGPMTDNYLEGNFFTVWRKRAFWLAALFIAEMATFNAMAYFDEAMKAITVLALFVPLCISTGGNSGSQAATLITRALALGQITPRNWLRVLRHELLMGLVLGLTLGIIAFARARLFTPQHVLENPGGSHTDLWRLTLVVSQAVMAICLWGTLVGSTLPMIFKRLGVDPGIASSPFVATFVDVTGIVIYFTIASIVVL